MDRQKLRSVWVPRQGGQPRKIDTLRVDREQLGGVEDAGMVSDRRCGFAVGLQILDLCRVIIIIRNL